MPKLLPATHVYHPSSEWVTLDSCKLSGLPSTKAPFYNIDKRTISSTVFMNYHKRPVNRAKIYQLIEE